MYQIDASEIQALLTQATSTALGYTQRIPQESKKYDTRTEFRVPEEENKRMKKYVDWKTQQEKKFPKWYKELFVKHQGEKEKSRVISTETENDTYSITRRYHYTQPW